MRSEHGPDMMIGPLVPATPTPQPQIKLSFESASPSDSQSQQDPVVKKLSFEAASSPPASQTEETLFSSASLAPEDVKQIAPAGPEQEAASSTEPQPKPTSLSFASAGSTTLIGITSAFSLC